MAGLTVSTQTTKKEKMALGVRRLRANGSANPDWSEPLSDDKVEEITSIVEGYPLRPEELALFRQYAPALRESHYNYIKNSNHKNFIVLMLRAFGRLGLETVAQKSENTGSTFATKHGSIVSTVDGYSFVPALKPGVTEAKNKKDKMKFTMVDAYVLAMHALSDESTKPPENKIRLEGNAEERRMLEIAISNMNKFLPAKERRVMTHRTGLLDAVSEFKVDVFGNDAKTFEELFGIPQSKINRGWNNLFDNMFNSAVPALAPNFAPTRQAKTNIAPMATIDEVIAAATADNKQEAPVLSSDASNMIAELSLEDSVDLSRRLSDIEDGARDRIKVEAYERALTENLETDELFESGLNGSPERLHENEAEIDRLVDDCIYELGVVQMALTESHETPELAQVGFAERGVVTISGEVEAHLAEMGKYVLENVQFLDQTETQIQPEENNDHIEDPQTAGLTPVDETNNLQEQGPLPLEESPVAEVAPPAPEPEPIVEVTQPASEPAQIEQAPSAKGMFTTSSGTLYADELYSTVRNIICSMPDDYEGRSINRLEKLIDSLPVFPGRENKDNANLALLMAQKLEKHGLVKLGTDADGNTIISRVTSLKPRDVEFNMITKSIMEGPEKWIGQDVTRVAQGLKILMTTNGVTALNDNIATYAAQGMLDQMVEDGLIKLDSDRKIKSITTDLMNIPAIRKDFAKMTMASIHPQTIAVTNAGPCDDNAARIAIEGDIANDRHMGGPEAIYA